MLLCLLILLPVCSAFLAYTTNHSNCTVSRNEWRERLATVLVQQCPGAKPVLKYHDWLESFCFLHAKFENFIPDTSSLRVFEISDNHTCGTNNTTNVTQIALKMFWEIEKCNSQARKGRIETCKEFGRKSMFGCVPLWRPTKIVGGFYQYKPVVLCAFTSKNQSAYDMPRLYDAKVY